ncbi:hypothetical protein DFH06DRAFT_921037, partial [Mycena polygramma]
LPKDKRAAFERLRDMPDDTNDDDSDDEGGPTPFNYDNVAEGNIEVDISHEGGEMGALQDELAKELNKAKRKRHDTRTRWDTTQRRVRGFRAQLTEMTDAYVKWGATQGEFGLDAGPVPSPPPPEEVQMHYKITVVDVFRSEELAVPMTADDIYTTSCLVRHGLIPSAPWSPKLAFSTRLMELYRLARLRCPTFALQPWLKTLADLHGVAFKPYTAQQFSSAFDVYLDIQKTVDERIMKELGRDAPDWRLKNCCPACTYKLEGEMKLIFEMLTAIDGNNSLKRVLMKERGVDENGVPLRGGSERPDPRTSEGGGSYFMTREKVDRWSKDVLAQLVTVPRSADPDEDSECQERWKNMSEELTERMWGIFDETGVFLALCRHGFVLLVADMVRSGELAKYGLAVTDALLDAFGPDLGLGYDIGCGFGTTIGNSPLGPKAKRLNLKTLVGAFHGHAHNRLCQLKYLVTYLKGLGLEDLEGCERFFSKSNALSRSVRYASVFHRRQSIATYLAHVDTFEMYANLSNFLVNNYKQALALIDLEDSLKYAMDQAGIAGPEVFKERLKQETEYLKNLKKEPVEETDSMEYYQRLVRM